LTTVLHHWLVYRVRCCCACSRSVLNTAARVVFSARRSEHITPLLRELHWLKVPERILFRLCVLKRRFLHGTAPPYLAETLQSTADVQRRRRLRSASTSTLVIPPTRRATIGDCAFPAAASLYDRAFSAAASHAWNSLPTSVREIQSQPAFCRKFKTSLFVIFFSGRLTAI